MNLILVKMFATALALAQVTTRPESLKTEFDPANEQAEVVQLLKDGCAHMRKAFDIEDLNLDSLALTELLLVLSSQPGVTFDAASQLQRRSWEGVTIETLVHEANTQT